MEPNEIVTKVRSTAKKWEAASRIMGAGALTLHDTLNESADCIEHLQAELEASKRRERAAVEDIEKMLDDAEPCDFCGNTLCCRKGGSDWWCEPKWRGPEREGE